MYSLARLLPQTRTGVGLAGHCSGEMASFAWAAPGQQSGGRGESCCAGLGCQQGLGILRKSQTIQENCYYHRNGMCVAQSPQTLFMWTTTQDGSWLFWTDIILPFISLPEQGTKKLAMFGCDSLKSLPSSRLVCTLTPLSVCFFTTWAQPKDESNQLYITSASDQGADLGAIKGTQMHFCFGFGSFKKHQSC